VIQANVVSDAYKEISRSFDLMSQLDARKKLSIEEYEKIHSGQIAPNEWTSGASRRFVLNSIGQDGTRAEGDREYTLRN
jgi:3-hydroxy-3-methylglutaryl CoA synthase